MTYTQTFDAENRMISVTVGGQTTQFVYDGYGNLVKKIKPDGSSTIYIGSIYEVDKSSGGAVTRTVTYYPAGGAMRIDGNVYYVLKDRLGSAYVTTDTLGNVVGEMRYYAFGETRLSTGNMFTDRLFTGQRYIAELGIYHFNARFYSPTLGRFLSADSIMSGMANPQNLNRYSYVANNPINANDPTGHYCVGDLEGCRDETGAPVNGAPLYLHQDDAGGGGDDGSEGSDGGGSGSGDGDGPTYNGCNQLGMSMDVCKTTINILNAITIGADVLGAVVSFVEWAFVGPPLIGGVLVGGVLAIFEPKTIAAWPAVIKAFLIYDAGVANTFAPVENNLGLVSLATTASVDWLEGYTYIDDNGDIYVGTTTAKTVGTTVAGLIPEANIDFAASLTQLTVDFSPKSSINVSQLAENIVDIFH